MGAGTRMNRFERVHEAVDRDVLELGEVVLQGQAVGTIGIVEDCELAAAGTVNLDERVLKPIRREPHLLQRLLERHGQILLRHHVEEMAKQEVPPGDIRIGNLVTHHDLIDADRRRGGDLAKLGCRVACMERRLERSYAGIRFGSAGFICDVAA